MDNYPSRERGQVHGLTRYDPGHASSDNNNNGYQANLNSDGSDRGYMGEEEGDGGYYIPGDSNNRDWIPQLPERSKRVSEAFRSIRLDEETIELLRLIANTADGAVITEGRPIDNDTDFPSFFQAFKSFMEKNNYDTKGSLYNNCMTIMVSLMNYPQPTWAERLERCLTDHSIAERKRIRKEHLYGHYDDFMYIIKERFFYRWYERTIETDNQLAMADFKDTNHLRSEVLSRWMYRLRLNDDNLKYSYWHAQHRIKGIFWKRWRTRKKSVDINTVIEQKMVKRKFLSQWMTQMTDIENLNELSFKINNRFILRSQFIDWVYKTMETRLVTNYNKQLAAEAFNTWSDKSRRIQINLSQSVTSDNKKLVTTSFYIWQDETDKILQDTSVAYEMSNIAFAKHSLNTLRRAAHLSKLEKQHCNKYAKGVLSEYFQTWHQRTLQIKEAKRFEDFMLKLRFFKHWRRETGGQLVTNLVDYNIATKYLRNWLLAERGLMFVRYNDGLAVKRIFDTWIDKTIDVRVNTQQGYEIISEEINSKKLHSALDSWKTKYSQLVDLTGQATDYRVDSLLRLGIDNLKIAYADISDLNKEAAKISRIYSLRKALTHWKEYATSHKITRLRETCSKWIENRENDTKQKVIEHWIGRLWELENKSYKADSVYRANQMKIAQNIFIKWRTKTEKLYADYSRGDAIYDNSNLALQWFKWVDRKNVIDQAAEEAGFILDIKDIERQEGMFRLWRMKMFKLDSKIRDAELFQERLYNNRFRRLWRLWRAKTSDAVATATAAADIGTNMTGGGSSQNSSSDATLTVTKDNYNNNNSSANNPLLETPTRVRSRKKVQFTSVDRWRKIKAPSFSPTKSIDNENSDLMTPSSGHSIYKTPQTNDTYDYMYN